MFRDEDARSNIQFALAASLALDDCLGGGNPLLCGAVRTACRRARYASIACGADRIVSARCESWVGHVDLRVARDHAASAERAHQTPNRPS
jgi:hypothetical protein